MMLEKEMTSSKVYHNSGLLEFPLLIILISQHQKKKLMKSKFETATQAFLNSCVGFSCYHWHVIICLVLATGYLYFCLNNLRF